MKVIYQPYSETLRQSPGNYLLAHNRGRGGWICEPDLAANKDLCVKIFRTLFDHKAKYSSGEELLKMLDNA